MNIAGRRYLALKTLKQFDTECCSSSVSVGFYHCFFFLFLFFTDVVLFLSQWFEDKLQEVENEEQHLRKLHAVVDSLVNHRKGERFSGVYPVQLLWQGRVN